ncbi:MAG: baseplate J/gp47 family protein [Bacteroidota bacterium]
MIEKLIYNYLLSTDGVNQLDRSPPALDPANLKIDGRSKQDILQFLLSLSSQIRYYDENHMPQGDWKAFLNELAGTNGIPDDAEIEGLYMVKKDAPPHVALLLAFLRIYSYLQDDVNKLSTRRLNFYFEEALQVMRRAASEDQVHVFFELTKNAKPTLIEAGTLLDAGTTKSGLPLQYAMESDLLVNHAVISSLRSSYVDFNKAGKQIVFKSMDARQVKNEPSTSWRPFGSSQLTLPVESRKMEPVEFGWAVASPNFLMAEGTRFIDLSFQLKSKIGYTFPSLVLESKLDISVTGEKEWLFPDEVEKAELIADIPVELQDPGLENPFTLDIRVKFNESAPALTPYNEEVHQGNYSSRLPVINISVKPESYILETLSIFTIDQITIMVEAKGVKELVLQNDQAVQAASKPVLPFGNNPMIGSNLYIGSEEIFSKSLNSLNIKLEWQDPPEDFIDQYSHYGNPNILTQSFLAEVRLLSGRNWNTLLLTREPLFDLTDPTLIREMPVLPVTFETQLINSIRNPELKLSSAFDSTVKQGFIRMQLTSSTKTDLGNLPAAAPFEAFGHKTFPYAYTQQVIALSKHTTGTPPELPKPPYTPMLKSITLDYSAKDILNPGAPNHVDQYFIRHVFGPVEVKKNDDMVLVPSRSDINALYFGLEKFQVPQSVSLLFQIEEGSVPGEELLRSEDLNWSYLAGSHWQSISSADIMEDSTDGFQKSGLVRLNIGSDVSPEHSMMSGSLHWLRVNVENNPEGAAGLIDIFTQAARGKLDFGNVKAKDYEAHLQSPLPPDTISSLSVKVPAVKKVSQPFPSFGGRTSESNQLFYQRISERLRHKNRAVTGWDYERLLLEFFPEIFKIKCLPHSDNSNVLKPGDIWLVVVPDWQKHPVGDPLQPKANRILLHEIAELISKKFSSSFANIHVTNPTYETLLVDCKVKFHAAFDPGYHSLLLNEEIKKFLSPWAYSQGKDIIIGGKIHSSEILAFIEGREYVDYVVDFELYHRHLGFSGGGIGDMEISLDFIIGYSPDPTIADSGTGEGGKTINEDFIVGEPVEVAIATRPDTILVSNAEHRIEALQADASVCEGTPGIGIGQMVIGLDFIPIS